MTKIGLTGGIATGKTTVSDFLVSLGVPVIDADVINQHLLLPQQAGYLKILELFPDTPLLTDLTLDKKALRDCIFNNSDSKKRLETALHPLIKEEIISQIHNIKIQNKHSYCIVSVPLLIEANFSHLVDKIWITDCMETLQCERLMLRDKISEKEANLIISHQLSRKERNKYADKIIETHDLHTMKDTIYTLNQQQIKLH